MHASNGAPRVVLVEDEADIRELIRYILVEAGIEVEELSDGAEALDLIRKAPPDLLVLDLMLPGLSGREICRYLRSSTENTSLPILIVSAKSSPSDGAESLALGADDYVKKPFSPRDLLARVMALLAHQVGAK